MELFLTIIGAFSWLITCALIGNLCGRQRGREDAGSALGLFLGPLGWAITLYLSDTRPQCPHCASPVLSPAATVCACCTRDLHPTPTPVARPLAVSTPRPLAHIKPAGITPAEHKALESFEVKLSR